MVLLVQFLTLHLGVLVLLVQLCKLQSGVTHIVVQVQPQYLSSTCVQRATTVRVEPTAHSYLGPLVILQHGRLALSENVQLAAIVQLELLSKFLAHQGTHA